jgi:tRNA(Ile)-lysidine synthase
MGIGFNSAIGAGFVFDGIPRRALPECMDFESLRKDFPIDRLETNARKILDDTRREPLFVACSGGADSTFLLYLIRAHYPKRTLYVLHFNHGVGDEFLPDERCAVEHAHVLDVEIFVGRRKDFTRRHETHLRAERYAFFSDILRRKGGRLLAVAHQADEVIETLFMRLLRGSGLGGLAAPRSVRHFSDGHVRLRPLTTTFKSEIRELLRQHSVTWVEDFTNSDALFCLRNTIRHRLIPLLDELFRSFHWRKNVLASHRQLNEDDDAVESAIRSINLDLRENWPLIVEPSDRIPKAFWKRILWRWIQVQSTQFPSSIFVDKILQCVTEGRNATFPIGREKVLVLYRNSLSLRHLPFQSPSLHPPWRLSNPAATLCFSNGRRLSWKRIVLTQVLLKEIYGGQYSHEREVFLDPRCGPPFVVRTWRAGDRYHPVGLPGSTKLKKQFSHRKMDVVQKHSLPLICDGNNNILWVPGLPPSNDFKLEDSASSCVHWIYD